MIIRNVSGRTQQFSCPRVTLLPGETTDKLPPKLAYWLQARGTVCVVEDQVSHDSLLWESENAGPHLLWMSPFSAGDGYGTAAEYMVHALVRAGVQLNTKHLWFLVPQGLLTDTLKMLRKEPEGEYLVGLCMATPGEFAKLPTPYKIGLTMYESSDPLSRHPEWRHQCNAMDALFVPTPYVAELFGAFVRRPIRVTPLALSELMLRGARTPVKQPKDTFTVVNFGTLTIRKCPQETLKLFQQAFPVNKYPDARMVFKTRAGFFGPEGGAPPNLSDPRIKIIDEDRWTREQVFQYLDDADCMFFLSHGEGYGMPVREAIAMGVPTILSSNTGHAPVCDARYNWPVPDKGDEKCPLGGNWSIPDWDYAVDTLRWIYEHREEAYVRAQRGAVWYAENFGNVAIAQTFVDALRSLPDPHETVRRRLQKQQDNQLTCPIATVKELRDKIAQHTPFYQTVAKLWSGPVVVVGVGSGDSYLALAGNGREVRGIDKDINALHAVSEALGAAGIVPNLEHLDAFNLGTLRSISNSAAVVQGVLEHYSDADIVRMCRTILSSCPKLFISANSVYFPCADNTEERLMRLEQWLDILTRFNIVHYGYYGPSKQSNYYIQIVIDGSEPPVRGTTIRYGRKADGVWRPT